MKFWKGMLLLFSLAIQGTTVLHSQGLGTESPTTEKKGLHCYTCLSHFSWEDCNAKAKLPRCEEGESCLTMKVYRRENVSGTEKILNHYAKYCSADCTDKDCKDMGWYCIVDCCNRDRCNASVTILANVTLIGAFFYLAVRNIFAF